MTPLTRPVLQMIGFDEQPPCDWVCFPPSGDRTPIAISWWHVVEGEFRGYRKEICVVAMPGDCLWSVYHVSLVRQLTTEESIRQGHAKFKAMQDLSKELGGGEEGAPVEIALPAETATGMYL